MADAKFNSRKAFKTRGGNKVSTVTFKNQHKIMGIIIYDDGDDGVFCSWDIDTGYRIGMGANTGEHIQDLINDPKD